MTVGISRVTCALFDPAATYNYTHDMGVRLGFPAQLYRSGEPHDRVGTCLRSAAGKNDAVAPARLGLIKRHVGLLHQVSHRHAGVRRKADASAECCLQGMAADQRGVGLKLAPDFLN